MAESQEETKLSGCLLAVFRNLVGPGLLLGLGAGLMVNRPHIGSPLDICYLAVLIPLVVASVFYGTKVESQKSADNSRLPNWVFTLIIAGGGSGMWILAHFVLRDA